LEIITDGTLKPSEAIKNAANILLDYFQQIIKPKKAPKEEAKEPVTAASISNDLTVEELDLPTRIANALRKGGYGTLNDLIASQG
jgi:DNA-directed RNA polymerase alpha subunit